MKPIEEILRDRFSVAIGLAFGPENVIDPIIKPADPKHADYQSNVAMPLAKKLTPSLPPRQVAQRVLQRLDLADICEPLTDKSIAGPGFINLRLKKEFLAAQLRALAAEPQSAFRAGADTIASPDTVVIDYSGPNVAKQMHVGHLRSTIIGDTIARAMEFLGHTVVRQNHIGDFGTQFGMLIHYIRTNNLSGKNFTIPDLDTWYKAATTQFKTDPAFAEIARRTVVELQSGQPDAVALWNRMRVVTKEHYTEVYRILNVTLTDADERGESFYGSRLPRLIERVRNTLEFGGEGASPTIKSAKKNVEAWDVSTEGLSAPAAAEVKEAVESKNDLNRLADAAGKETAKAVEKPFAAVSDGALCIFLPGYVTEDGSPLPLMVQKSDGGFPYSATDLAALYFRVQENKTTPEEQKPLDRDWHGSRVIYFTDSRQSQHFAMVFDAFRAAKWDVLPDGRSAVLEHAPFGAILGEDRKPYKTRSGNAAALIAFLEDAIDAAYAQVAAKNPDLPEDKKRQVARSVGIAAVKYADLRNDRATDYVFNPDQMVAFEGNTGPYLQYAFTRVRSIFRKAGVSPESVANAPLILDAPEEVALAKAILKFPGVIESVARDLKPHYLCTFLYELATAFSTFYQNCPVLQAPSEEIKRSRLLLAHLVAQTLDLGLTKLLGIQTLEEM